MFERHEHKEGNNVQFLSGLLTSVASSKQNVHKEGTTKCRPLVSEMEDIFVNLVC